MQASADEYLGTTTGGTTSTTFETFTFTDVETATVVSTFSAVAKVKRTTAASASTVQYVQNLWVSLVEELHGWPSF